MGGGYYGVAMPERSDAQRLRDYAERGDESAFTELVHRHKNLWCVVQTNGARKVTGQDVRW